MRFSKPLVVFWVFCGLFSFCDLTGLAKESSSRKKMAKARKSKGVLRQKNAVEKYEVRVPEIFILKESFCPSIDLPGIGVARFKVENNPELLGYLKEKYVGASWFGVLRQPTFSLILNCETEYANKIFSTFPRNENSGIGSELLQALHAKESFCRNVRSPTGPLGWSQFARATARSYGLSPSDRLIPEKSVAAAFRHLQDLFDEFSDVGLALWGYHSGVGVPRKARLLAIQEGMSEPITMDKLMFVASPFKYVKTYEFMREAYKTDYSITYYYGVLAMRDILKARKEDKAWVNNLWQENQLVMDQSEGGDLKYANRYEYFLDSHGNFGSSVLVRFVRKSSESQVLSKELQNLPDEATLGLYYYLVYKLNDLEDFILGRNFGQISLRSWSKHDLSIDLNTTSFRKVWIVELLRQLAMQEVLGFEQKGGVVNVVINPKMKIWGMSLFFDNNPTFIP